MAHDDLKLTRREALTAAAAACVAVQAGPASAKTTGPRAPVIYLPHGGGPWPFVDLGFDKASLARLSDYLRTLAALTPAPRALLVISAHWEEPRPTVMTAARPPMLYDYYGFPAEAYRVQWPAPGDPALASRVRGLLGAAGIDSGEDPGRGFDHGTFVPLKVTWPAAQIPTVQLSLQRGLDPAVHLAIGRALAPLRDEGVLILGSGMSYHNMRGFRSGTAGATSEPFDRWLQDTVQRPAAERDARLSAWHAAPHARACHPREEHLLPLMVVAGAALDDRGVVPYSDSLMGARVSAVHFG